MVRPFACPESARQRGRKIGARGLWLSAALLPLMHAAAAAETVISTATTTPIATSTAAAGAPDDVRVDGAGSITLGGPGAAITLDSNNTVVSTGTISSNNQSDSTAILVTGGRTGSAQTAGTINLVEDYQPTDADGDGDLDGPMAQGWGRYGIRVVGPQPFTGPIVNARGGQMTIEGADSAGISVETRLQGDLVNAGGIAVVGDRSVGVRAGDVAGHVRITGSISAIGQDAVGVSLGEVAGQVLLQNAIAATGYRYGERLADDVRAKLDADDLLQGGGAVRITGNVWGGVLLDRQPIDANPNVADEDGDGVDDALEGTAALVSRGSAPGLAIGGPADIRLGRVGADADAYGLVIKGQIAGLGVNDGIAANALSIGGVGRTVVEGGLHLRAGRVEAQAYGADASAIRLGAGAEAAEIRNSGGVIAANTTSAGAHKASAVLIEAGATASRLINQGQIVAEVAGSAGTAQAIVDRSGGLSLIENYGSIIANVAPTEGAAASWRAVALDLSANTSGVTLRQFANRDGDDGADGAADADADGDGVDDGDEAVIRGEVLLGSGDDRVELNNGVVDGLLSFGLGADTLVLDDGAQVIGVLTDADGRLDVDVRKGSLAFRFPDTVRLTSLRVGADGALSLALDPKAGTASRIEASGEVVIDSGAEIGLTLKSLPTGPQSFEIVQAGTLRADGVSGTLVGAPYLFNAGLRADAGSLFVDVRARTAQEMQLRRSEAQAFDAVFAAIGRDSALESAFLSKMDRDSFVGLYEQMLPDHSGATLMSAAAVTGAVSTAVRQRSPLGSEAGQRAFWAHQYAVNLDHDRRDAQGYRLRGFGLAFGFEREAFGGADLGLAFSLASTQHSDDEAATDERVVMNMAGGSLYLRKELGGLTTDVRAGGGVIAFDSNRHIVSAADNLNLEAEADWLGWFVDAHLGVGYRADLGPLYVRPEAQVDYLRLQEQSYEESGAGSGADLGVDSRRGTHFTGTASLSFGLEFGDTFRWGPEFTVGQRKRFSGGPGPTDVRFLGGGPTVSLDPETAYSDATILRGGFRGTGSAALFAVDGGVEMDGPYTNWDVRAVVKLAF